MPKRAPNPNIRIFAFVLIIAGLVIGLAAIWRQLPILPITRVELPPPAEPSQPVAPPSQDPAKLACDLSGGKWIECGSPCHGSLPGTACIQVCEPQCLCGGASNWTCPSELSCQSKDEQGIGVCRKDVGGTDAIPGAEPVTGLPEKPLGMMCDKTQSICVNRSYQNTLLASPFSVTGTAIAFEQQFAWRLEDANELKLEEGNTMTHATDTGQYGPFTIRAFILSVPKTATGTLVLYEPSPRDGSEEHVLRIPVRLPRQAMTVKIYRASGLHELDCGDVEPIERQVVSSKLPIETTLQRLLVDAREDGPRQPERGILLGTRLLSLNVSKGTATAVFSRELESYGGGSCRVAFIRAEIEQTLKQFSSVKSVVISVEGKTPAETLQP